MHLMHHINLKKMMVYR